MSNGRIIELSSLVERHKDLGYDLYQTNGPRTVYRLTNDKLIPANGSRDVRVNWIARPGRKPPSDINVTIRWSDVPGLEKRRPGVVGNANSHRLTEDAAITVMFLLISDLENVSIKSVLQIGSGPDYVTYPRGEKVEVSGIHQASVPSESTSQLRKKVNGCLRRNALDMYRSRLLFILAQ